MSTGQEVDLVVDLNTQDETGFPWAFLDTAPYPRSIVPGAYVIAGSGVARAVARVLDVVDGVVHVQPLPGSVSSNAGFLTGREEPAAGGAGSRLAST